MEEPQIKRIKTFHTFNNTENELNSEQILPTIETKIQLLDNKINQIGMLCNYMVKTITHISEKNEHLRMEILNSNSTLQVSFNTINNNLTNLNNLNTNLTNLTNLNNLNTNLTNLTNLNNINNISEISDDMLNAYG